VSFDEDGGSDSQRLDLERAVAGALREHGCFRSVRSGSDAPGAPDDLRLNLVVMAFEDEQVHDVSVAQRHSSSSSPDAAHAYVARIAAQLRVSIETADGDVVRAKKFAHAGEHRPLLGEDARHEAKREFEIGIVDVVRRFACRGTEKSWRNEIARARDEAAGAR
jgi:hypothetical protein